MSDEALILADLPQETVHRLQAEAEAAGLVAVPEGEWGIRVLVLTYNGGMVGVITSVKEAGAELLVEGLLEFPVGSGQSFMPINWKPVTDAMKLIKANHLVARSAQTWN